MYLQAPVWFLIWSLAVGALLLWREETGRSLRRVWIAALTVVALVLCLIMIEPLWAVVPFPYAAIQFPYRLGSYLFYAVAALVLISALLLQRQATADPTGRLLPGLRAALIGACAISIGLCVWQEWVPNTRIGDTYEDRGQALASASVGPRTWYDPGSYSDRSAPVVPTPDKLDLIIAPATVHGERFAAWVKLPEGRQPFQTNIAGGSYLVHISGVQPVGRDPEGLVVVRRLRGSHGPVHLVIETAHSFPIELGRILSILAVLAVLLLVLGAGARGRRIARRSTTNRT